MPNLRSFSAATVAAFLLLGASPASAQMYELVGNRAQGMGGAFIAVADDATATWWNPAGIATGAYFSLVLERTVLEEPEDPLPGQPAWRSRANSLAIGFPALALSYYRVHTGEVVSGATADEVLDRQDEGVTAPGVVRALALSQYGATFGQSFGDHVVLATTTKLVRGGLVTTAGSGANLLDLAEQLDVDVETKGDLDVGALVSLGGLRVGLSVRHLNEPEFGEGDGRFRLSRQGRLGAAWVWSRPVGPLDALTAAVDTDLTETTTVLGDVRHVAAGLEAWLLSRRLGLRGGVSSNREVDGHSSVSAGLSLGLGSGLYVDGALTVGSDDSRRGWALGARVAF